MSSEKKTGLWANLIIYLIAFAIGFVPYYLIISTKPDRFIEAMFIFTMVAILVVPLSIDDTIHAKHIAKWKQASMGFRQLNCAVQPLHQLPCGEL